ncbi:hypothetical protein [Actinomadura sp. GC306]|nr:hypothetical protein [Actinomadura sp. GC306]
MLSTTGLAGVAAGLADVPGSAASVFSPPPHPRRVTNGSKTSKDRTRM